MILFPLRTGSVYSGFGFIEGDFCLFIAFDFVPMIVICADGQEDTRLWRPSLVQVMMSLICPSSRRQVC
jgi:hypothetical protein